MSPVAEPAEPKVVEDPALDAEENDDDDDDVIGEVTETGMYKLSHPQSSVTHTWLSR